MDRYQITFRTWNTLADVYQDKFMDLDLYDDTYDQFCDLVKPQGASVLEIGCGPGNITRYMISKRPDFNILATDVAPNMIALAQDNNPSVRVALIDCREIDQLTETFDGIVCGFCMPYLSKEDCHKLIRDCSALLEPGGIFYCSAIEDDYNKSAPETSSDGRHQMFVYCHEAGYLTAFLKENGFEVVAVERKKYTKSSDGSESTHLILISRKK